jgi:hypothetical protein
LDFVGQASLSEQGWPVYFITACTYLQQGSGIGTGGTGQQAALDLYRVDLTAASAVSTDPRVCGAVVAFVSALVNERSNGALTVAVPGSGGKVATATKFEPVVQCTIGGGGGEWSRGDAPEGADDEDTPSLAGAASSDRAHDPDNSGNEGEGGQTAAPSDSSGSSDGVGAMKRCGTAALGKVIFDSVVWAAGDSKTPDALAFCLFVFVLIIFMSFLIYFSGVL